MTDAPKKAVVNVPPLFSRTFAFSTSSASSTTSSLLNVTPSTECFSRPSRSPISNPSSNSASVVVRALSSTLATALVVAPPRVVFQGFHGAYCAPNPIANINTIPNIPPCRNSDIHRASAYTFPFDFSPSRLAPTTRERVWINSSSTSRVSRSRSESSPIARTPPSRRRDDCFRARLSPDARIGRATTTRPTAGVVRARRLQSASNHRTHDDDDAIDARIIPTPLGVIIPLATTMI